MIGCLHHLEHRIEFRQSQRENHNKVGRSRPVRRPTSAAMTSGVALLVGVAGAAAGGLGALLGIGGGVFLVPFLNDVVGFPLSSASGVGLMTVMATSSIVSTGRANRELINLRLGMVL